MIQAMVQQYSRVQYSRLITESKKSIQCHPFISRNFAVLPPNEGFGTAYILFSFHVYLYKHTLVNHSNHVHCSGILWCMTLGCCYAVDKVVIRVAMQLLLDGC